MHISGYDAELQTFAHAHIPVFFSQYGSNLGACGRRIFQETTALYSPVMTRIFSGGIAYEFYDHAPSAAPAVPGTRIGAWGYGLVRAEDATPVGRGLTKLPDFLRLRARLEKVCEPDGMPIFQRRMSEESFDDDDDELADFAQNDEDKDARMEHKALPQLSAHWRAGYALPSVADWKGVQKNLEAKAWVDVDGDVDDVDEMPGAGLGLRDNESVRLVRA